MPIKSGYLKKALKIFVMQSECHYLLSVPGRPSTFDRPYFLNNICLLH